MADVEKTSEISAARGRSPQSDVAVDEHTKLESKMKNPLEGIPKDELLRRVDEFARDKGLEYCLEDLRKGALVAQDPPAFESLEELSEEEKLVLREEKTRRWHQPFMLYFMTVLCAGSAIVQGMDQSSVNGAQEFYFEEFGVTDVWMQGLLNGAPYLCSVALGCWTTAPLNNWFGRRGTIFAGCFMAFVTGLWMAFADSWYNLFIARFMMGFAIGAKSTTTPVYGAECAPANIRGALVMMWQMWTAFGIMLGFIAGVAFVRQPVVEIRAVETSGADICPDGRPTYSMAFDAWLYGYTALLCDDPGVSLPGITAMAARDVYYIHCCLEVEKKMREGKSLWKEFFVRPRNRRAAQSAFFVMFMQQFCGVNVIAYYSNRIFREADLDRRTALVASLGTGICNWVFAIPAVYTIDTFGRRNLLLTTFPLMALCLYFTGFSFFIPRSEGNNAQFACVATGLYLFMAVYSPGEGPVPFTYSAEAFPLYIRDVGMSFATATCWGFNFIISLTWPALLDKFKPQGAFAWYATWNLFGFVYAYFCLRETTERTLEELDHIFNLSTRRHAQYYFKSIPWYFRKWILRQDVPARSPLYN